jgi:hypothetical protein
MDKIRQNFLLRDTPQVILDLMTPVSRLNHVGGREKGWSDRQTHTQILIIIYIDVMKHFHNYFISKITLEYI